MKRKVSLPRGSILLLGVALLSVAAIAPAGPAAEPVGAKILAIDAKAGTETAGDPAPAQHNTCGLISQVPGGEAAVEAWALASLNANLPVSFSDKVKIGEVPVTNDPIRVEVDATVKKPAKNVNIVCAASSLSSSLDIKVKVSGRAGSSTHNGDARIKGAYTVSISPVKVCVKNLKVSDLNLQNVQNQIDNWIRKKINQSGLVADFCVP